MHDAGKAEAKHAKGGWLVSQPPNNNPENRSGSVVTGYTRPTSSQPASHTVLRVHAVALLATRYFVTLLVCMLATATPYTLRLAAGGATMTMER